MYDIKQKVWKKKFEKDEIDIIIDQASKIVPYLDFNGDVSLASAIGNYFCHLETDISNNTVGISPKQIKSFISLNSINEIANLFVIMTYIGVKNKQRYLDEDNQLNWSKVFKEYALDKTIVQIIDSLEISDELKILTKANPYMLFLESPQFNRRKTLIKMKVAKEKIWKKALNRIPQDELLTLFVMPNNFNGKLAGEFKNQFGTIKDIEDNHLRFKLIQLLRKPMKLSQFNYSDAFYNEATLSDGEKEILENIPEKTLEHVDINKLLSIFKDYNFTNVLISDLIESTNQNSSNVSLIVTFHEAMSKVAPEIAQEMVFLSLYIKRTLVRQYNQNIPINSYVDLWTNRAESRLYLGKIKSKKYSIEMMDISDPEQMILGEATDCCQHINGAGYSCLINGMKNNDQGFVKVTKKGKIYAQSWYWTHEDEHYGKFLCFDSIECPSGSNTSEIIDLYIELSEQLIKDYGFDLIVTGRDGSRIPDEVLKLDNIDIYANDIKSLGYSDTNTEGCSVLARKVD